ncbi:glycoside hydrolase 5 family protein [Lutibacter citreus]|uniref:cellulase family glycosylhydrolase n=1 Tax=Lutibacter citreus TaxID=2138210 RepID=UPI000DBE5B99|nr:cellulase family glycosylhydrolase [Lutibacter citreus]
MRKIVLILFAFIFSMESFGQSSTYIDDNGIMRWSKNKEEVCVFGTNYSVPFAYWNQRAPLIGDNHKKAIDEDVYHMARLGIDGFRIHVMESFIVDEKGNLIYNQHFELFDYLLFKLKERGIKMYITPMYLGGGGNTNSFTAKYGMGVGCLSNEKAFPAQENYLKQFVSHINPLTGIAYKDDPDIIAFEIVNEPKHWKEPKLIKKYIGKMYKAIRSTGCDKPLMYNMTTCSDFIDDVLDTKIDGGSFQWYPTGLTSNHEQKGNLLPNVDQYIVPFQDKLTESKRPKFVYEFSPSDTKGAYMYPAMARSFREAGFQFVAHFSYDALHAAHTNVAYKTHFLNLAYTPKKAIGLMIASEVFHKVALNKSFGRFPDNNEFDDFSLSYENDLTEMNSDKKFLYSNSTETLPKSVKKLEKIAGTGNSPIVQYLGTGAYFLDKLEKGVWRLEVMPDAHWVKDPFFVPYTYGEVAVTISREHSMKINIPELGSNFRSNGINKGNVTSTSANEFSILVSPGVYLLQAKEINYSVKEQLKEFHIPANKPKQNYVLHHAPKTVSVGENLVLEAEVITENNIEQVEVIILNQRKQEVFPLHKLDNGFKYELAVPKNYLKTSQLIRYYISCKINGDYYSYPGGEKDTYLLDRRIYSDDLSLDDEKPYVISVLESSSPITLFNATDDWENITKMGRSDKINVYPSGIPNLYKLRFTYPKKNKYGDEFGFKYYCADKIIGRKKDLITKNKIIFHGQSIGGKDNAVTVQLLMKDGSAYSGKIQVGTELRKYSISIDELVFDKYPLLPRAYPKFQVYNFKPSLRTAFNIGELESVQLLLHKKENLTIENTVEIYTIGLE